MSETDPAHADAVIARQEREIAQLRDALTRALTAGVIGSPVTHAELLEMIVATGAHVIGARAGALFLLDEERSELTFEVAIGSKAQEAKRFRVPLGHGIAGIVASTGQAMAIADAANDPRLASDIADSVGYVPQTVLCVPLFYGSDVIGALELLDKDGGERFTAADLEALGLFANQAAVALQLSRTHERIAQLLGGDGEAGPIGETLELAELVHEIARRGDAEREACRSLLLGLAEYLRGPR